MPWKESRLMDERLRFIARLMDGEGMAELCREFGISRKTGYKFFERYERYGVAGLTDQSRRPHRFARQTASQIERLILDLKELYPTWGPKKLKAKLESKHPGLQIPAASTIGDLLARHGLIRCRKRRRIEERLFPKGMSHSTRSNEIWCVDFKGQFRLGNQQYCYPLTITDHFSRYLLCCEALVSTKGEPTRAVFERVFDEYGVPAAIKSDNGAPFSARSLGGLSELSAWWLRLGIRLERSAPGHPEHNGRHERMHLTLKQETTRPAGQNLLQQQERFDDFRATYNDERPHEALGMRVPSSLYSPSSRRLSDCAEDSTYPTHDYTRRVSSRGHFSFHGRNVYLSKSLRGQVIGLRDLEEGRMLVSLGPFDLGCFDRDLESFHVETTEVADA